jgi:hypothetical protein
VLEAQAAADAKVAAKRHKEDREARHTKIAKRRSESRKMSEKA